MTETEHLRGETLEASQALSTRRWSVPVLHLLVSVAVITSVAVLIFGVWFPAPFRELAGGTRLFWIIIGIDAVCGPFLTWLLFNRSKTRLALTVDICLVVAIQLAALGYGMHVLSLARPLAVVYEVDRFRIVSFSDIPEIESVKAPDWAHPWGFSEIRVVGIRPANTLDEKMSSVEASLQGVQPGQRPEWWQDYVLSIPRVLQRARPLAELRQKHPTEQGILDEAVSQAMADMRVGETPDAAQLRWLPLVSRRTMNWVVLLDPSTARPRGYAALDGF